MKIQAMKPIDSESLVVDVFLTTRDLIRPRLLIGIVLTPIDCSGNVKILGWFRRDNEDRDFFSIRTMCAYMLTRSLFVR